MSYLTRKFTWVTHADTGIDGWLMDSCKNDPLFIPGAGPTVAHDTMEHFACDGSMEDECLAFGSLYYIRAENGRIRNYERTYITASESFASDLATMFRDNDYADLKPAPRVRQSHNTEALYNNRNEMEAYFLRYVHSEDSEAFVVDEFRTAEDVAEFRLSMAAWFDRAFQWMVIGYRKAMRRWSCSNHAYACNSGVSAYEACDLFWQLAEEVDKIKGEEGDTLAVHVNIKRRSYNLVHRNVYGFEPF